MLRCLSTELHACDGVPVPRELWCVRGDNPQLSDSVPRALPQCHRLHYPLPLLQGFPRRQCSHQRFRVLKLATLARPRPLSQPRLSPSLVWKNTQVPPPPSRTVFGLPRTHCTLIFRLSRVRGSLVLHNHPTADFHQRAWSQWQYFTVTTCHGKMWSDRPSCEVCAQYHQEGERVVATTTITSSCTPPHQARCGLYGRVGFPNYTHL